MGVKMVQLFNMLGRSPQQSHRAATNLELFFDLVFVVAIAQAAAQLHHGFVEQHFAHATQNYLLVFFSIWWAWMCFSWFASAFDNDDTIYRLLTFSQMVGVLLLAAGIPDAFNQHDWTLGILGFVLMRISLVLLWLRVYFSAQPQNPLRSMAIKQVIGITLCQIGWVLLLLLHGSIGWFVLLILCEVLVPVWAKQKMTPWHAGHIAERYGLLTLIVLGESVLSLSLAVAALDDRPVLFSHLSLMIGSGLVILFSMWWLYFFKPAHELLERSDRQVFAWGYGHYLIFASAAAVGAALAAEVDVLTRNTGMGSVQQGLILGVPLTLFLFGHWYCHERCRLQHGAQHAVYLTSLGLILAVCWLPSSSVWIAAILVGLVIWRERVG